MPTSLPHNIPYMLTIVAKNILPKIALEEARGKRLGKLPEFKVLDIGCGFGKWGFLIRDCFDVLIGQNFKKSDWKISITGVEPFKNYIGPLQKEIYNKIIQKDIFDAIGELEKYDLIIMGDVIEHIEKEKVHQLLKKLFEFSGNILISTPLGFLPQKSFADNEMEIHKSGWTQEDFKEYNVVEYKIISDELFGDLWKEMRGTPKTASEIKLLAIWLKK